MRRAMRRPTRIAAVLAAFGLLGAASAYAQGHDDADDWCEDSRYDRDGKARFCDVREQTLTPAGGPLAVDAAPNGGIRVEGGQRSDILVRARVQTWARTDSRAREIASSVRVLDDGSSIRAEGPRSGHGEGWSVSYRVSVPTRTDLRLTSTNGGISIVDVDGDLEFRTTNGGVRLDGLAGDVRGSTTNGGVSVRLTGSQWVGGGLDVRTTNGGVKLWIPDGYSANLETGTTNGGIDVRFPITVQGRLSRRLTTELGSGGNPIRAMTTNGGVVVTRS